MLKFISCCWLSDPLRLFLNIKEDANISRRSKQESGKTKPSYENPVIASKWQLITKNRA